MTEPAKRKKNGEPTVRAFIALALPSEVRDFLGRIQADLKKAADWPVKWVEPGNIHLTVKFLGDTGRAQLPSVMDAMQAAAGEKVSFRLKAMGLGAFPGIKRPRVIWCGVGGDLQALSDLQKSLDEALFLKGFEREEKRFKAHLTLARVKGRIDAQTLADAITRYGAASSAEFVADAITLYQSRLTPEGSVYSTLHREPLGRPLS